MVGSCGPASGRPRRAASPGGRSTSKISGSRRRARMRRSCLTSFRARTDRVLPRRLHGGGRPRQDHGLRHADEHARPLALERRRPVPERLLRDPHLVAQPGEVQGHLPPERWRHGRLHRHLGEPLRWGRLLHGRGAGAVLPDALVPINSVSNGCGAGKPACRVLGETPPPTSTRTIRPGRGTRSTSGKHASSTTPAIRAPRYETSSTAARSSTFSRGLASKWTRSS